MDPGPGRRAVGRLFHVRYTLRGTSYLLHRLGYTPQVPVHRAAERDEDAIAAWRAVTWGRVGCTARSRVRFAWIRAFSVQPPSEPGVHLSAHRALQRFMPRA